MDLLYGGAGDDVILGDGEIRQTIRMGSIAGNAQTVFWQENYTRTMLIGTAYVSVPYAQPANFNWTIFMAARERQVAMTGAVKLVLTITSPCSSIQALYQNSSGIMARGHPVRHGKSSSFRWREDGEPMRRISGKSTARVGI
jgi:hypothetical protein